MFYISPRWLDGSRYQACIHKFQALERFCSHFTESESPRLEQGVKIFLGKMSNNPWANNNTYLKLWLTKLVKWNSFRVEQQRLSIKDEFAQSTLEPLESAIIPHFNQIHFVLLLVVLVTMLWNAASIKEQRRLQKSIVWNYENTSALILMKIPMEPLLIAIRSHNMAPISPNKTFFSWLQSYFEMNTEKYFQHSFSENFPNHEAILQFCRFRAVLQTICIIGIIKSFMNQLERVHCTRRELGVLR